MVASSVLGFPRIGGNREVKKAVEAYWGRRRCRKTSWTSLKERGVDLIPSGDFSLYDHVLDHSAAFNVIPKRYSGHSLSALDVYFAMGRGRQADGVDVPACEMKKWFDSNYHFVVPEFSDETDFKLNFNKALEEYNEAKALGIVTRPVVLGPVSFLTLGKAAKEAKPAAARDLKAAGVESVQVDEPVLAYSELVPVSPKIVLATYYGRLASNLTFVANSRFAALKPTTQVLSLGVVSGRNIWKADLDAGIALGQRPSLSSAHCQQKDWFSFALEKAEEVAVLAATSLALRTQGSSALAANKASIAKRREFERTSDDAVRKRIRSARAKFNKKQITEAEYEEFIKKEIEYVVRFQERIGLDLLVHGEPERNDMVQYFGEQFQGFVFTQNGWVQSYGSRYVRPPIIVSDVSRPGPVTVKWSSYAQSVTSKPMKGMLTGPVTILNWSFPRADISRELQCMQLALALRDEVIDLEKAGIKAVQVDEPALREGLPLRKADWDEYLKWALPSFKLSTAGVTDNLQTHSHFCYSDFDDIFPSIQALDADVISIEASKSDMKLLTTFKQYGYSNQIGPGVYDIHSPRVPGEQEIKDRIAAMLEILPEDLLVINPETEASLVNLVNAARWARQTNA
ncbi:cobalamin-independent synthase [Fomitopsis serialis]|uniref:cobalamin-independent synthase n=1 Tax=Fomitopsis serialis TaxID=139415 RepID=UPI002007756B|nr:cobalamin-independent synthase [Neoantrodia serialis]KAH9938210.1 cobalamin-independent synthase [Neoantrodia serialis]